MFVFIYLTSKNFKKIITKCAFVYTKNSGIVIYLDVDVINNKIDFCFL